MKTRAIKINLDRTFEVFELDEYPDLANVLGAHFDIVWLNGPLVIHPRHITVGMAVDDEGLLKQLDVNRLASSIFGVFGSPRFPIVGPAVLIGSDADGERVDVPDWAVRLVTVVKECVEEATQHHQDPRFN